MLLAQAVLLLLTDPAVGTGLHAMSNAQACGHCHRAIAEAWKSSAHARGMESWLFQDALAAAEKELGAPTRRVCLGCHAPMAAPAGDLELRQKVSWEGVTCDYCHSIRDVDLTGQNPKAKVSFTLAKSGPLKDASSSAHPTAYSDVHESSRVCAPCHDYKNAQGFPVLSTFTEWRNSRYAKEGRNCQSCHMNKVAGNVVDPRLKRTQSAQVNLHQMLGSRSFEQLNKAVRARLSGGWEGDRLRVAVEIGNRAAGHHLPTGSPMHRLILEVLANTYDGRHFREERLYHRVVGDATGVPIRREHLAFVKAARVLSDTRLAPDETRTETFTFPLPPGVKTDVKATLSYYYSPMERSAPDRKTTFLILSRVFP